MPFRIAHGARVRLAAAYLSVVLTLLTVAATIGLATGHTNRASLGVVLMTVGGLVVGLFGGPSLSGVAERRSGDWKATLVEGSTSATGADLARLAAHDTLSQDRYLLAIGGGGATVFVIGLAALILGR